MITGKIETTARKNKCDRGLFQPLKKPKMIAGKLKNDRS